MEPASSDTNTTVTNTKTIYVDVIIPVHNAEVTIEEAVQSAMHQLVPDHLKSLFHGYRFHVNVCCYNDGSTDGSWNLLEKLEQNHAQNSTGGGSDEIVASLLIQNSAEASGRGAGYARNRAVALSTSSSSADLDENFHFLCLLDSDDTMHPHRIAEQTSYCLQIEPAVRHKTLLGCNFRRDPPDATWHYSQWANALDDDRLMLERFRELTVIQPTWFLTCKRFQEVGGYVESPPGPSDPIVIDKGERPFAPLIHPTADNHETIRLAEDLRLFHDHVHAGGVIRLHRTEEPLVMYRHSGTSQSFRTSRKLLQQLRLLAFERNILRQDPKWQHDNDNSFVIWGAGRDGKEFIKELSSDLRQRVYCFVDVDDKKLRAGKYVHRDLGVDVPIIHFSFLAADPIKQDQIVKEWERASKDEEGAGRITKTKPVSTTVDSTGQPASKKQRRQGMALSIQGLDAEKLRRLPVVVCVAMHRTNGVLEKNVAAIGRVEGETLWHFS
eukprot:Nitzschia sp. Nitz4//scaffold375_size13900//1178//2665//NITZ4_008963-RA/size13900-processed-gene-0.7-mRNA-1//-1//CDS//3329549636//9362//frame0